MSDETVLIVEDVPEAQQRLVEVVNRALGSAACVLAADLAESQPLLHRHRFNLALVDLSLPDGDGTTLIQQLASLQPDCTLVVASVYGDDGHLFPALRAGAQGYLLKDQPLEQLAQQLRGIRDGQPPLSPAIARRLLQQFRQTQSESPIVPEEDIPHLTGREREVLTLLSRGLTVSEIARHLGISRYTVGDHVKNIYRKLNIASRAEAALQASKLGLA